jgi:hypothetical protein
MDTTQIDALLERIEKAEPASVPELAETLAHDLSLCLDGDRAAEAAR